MGLSHVHSLHSATYDQDGGERRGEEEAGTQSEQEGGIGAIANNSARIQGFEQEQKRINEIAARFGSFLKHNAIMPYNDVIKAYLQLAIRAASRIAEITDDPHEHRKVDGLRECLRAIAHPTIVVIVVVSDSNRFTRDTSPFIQIRNLLIT